MEEMWELEWVEGEVVSVGGGECGRWWRAEV